MYIYTKEAMVNITWVKPWADYLLETQLHYA